MSQLNNIFKLRTLGLHLPKRCMSQLGDLGEGAGKGGGGGGSIREAGGAFGKMEAAKEEEYFYKQRQQQLEALKNKTHSALKDELAFHQDQIKRHQDAVELLKRSVKDLEK